MRAHVLLCLVAYYVEWHLRQAWEPLLFEDEELAVDRQRRDPVAPARASESARQKKKTHMTSGGLPVQSFRTLLAQFPGELDDRQRPSRISHFFVGYGTTRKQESAGDYYLTGRVAQLKNKGR